MQALLISPLFFTMVWCQAQTNPPPAIAVVAKFLDVSPDSIELVANNFVFRKPLPADSIVLNVFTLNTPSLENITPVGARNATKLLDFAKPLKIIIHGWINNGTEPWISQMASAYHLTQNCNVIAVDWSAYSFSNYLGAASSVRSVGEIVGDFLLSLTASDRRYLGQVHLVGHSLGAHIAGFVGKRVNSRVATKIGRITGLDTAGPLFDWPIPRSTGSKLAKTDATFVDTIHTNDFLIGAWEEHGTADFYVNSGGPIQPTCYRFSPNDAIYCSHIMCIIYFYLSILTPDLLLAQSCKSNEEFRLRLCHFNEKINFGEHTSLNASGRYYVDSF